VRGGRTTAGEGQMRSRLIVIEFDSLRDAQLYMSSSEYAAARAIREGAGIMDMVAVEGGRIENLADERLLAQHVGLQWGHEHSDMPIADADA
jgi:hypothetical protein